MSVSSEMHTQSIMLTVPAQIIKDADSLFPRVDLGALTVMLLEKYLRHQKRKILAQKYQQYYQTLADEDRAEEKQMPTDFAAMDKPIQPIGCRYSHDDFDAESVAQPRFDSSRSRRVEGVVKSIDGADSCNRQIEVTSTAGKAGKGIHDEASRGNPQHLEYDLKNTCPFGNKIDMNITEQLK